MTKNLEIVGMMYCRACLLEFINDNMPKAMKKYSIYPDLVEKFKSCTNTDIDEDDEFSKSLCITCYKNLTRCDSFQTMCIASLQRLREMLLLVDPITEKNIISKAESDVVKSLDTAKQQTIKAITSPQTFQVVDVENMKASDFNNSISMGDKSSTNSEEILSKEPKGNKKECRKRKEDGIVKTQKTPIFFECELCSMRFFVEHRLEAHKRSHDGLVPYPCPRKNCGRGFKRWHYLNEHLKQHDGTNRWFTCKESECNRQYKHKTTLDMHIRSFHKKGPELKSFVCETCGKVFKSSAVLNYHRLTHKDMSELPLSCSEPDCKRRFLSKEKLKIHLMRHAGIKKFKCPHCDMLKTTRSELKIHINYHTLERTYPCNFCKHICNSAGNLKAHIRTVHERAKDYHCRFCERTFAKLYTRKYHEMIHTGEKPHQCVECGKCFVQPAALRAHKKIHQKKKHTQTKEPAYQNKTDDTEFDINPTYQ